MPEPGPDQDQLPDLTGEERPRDRQGSDAARAHADSAAGSLPGWVAEVVESGPKPGAQGSGLPAGLDYQALLEALAASGALDGDRGQDQDTVPADQPAADADARVLPGDPAWVAALAVEHMEPGAAQAGWLEVAAGAVHRLDENALVGVAVAARRLASRAQATELAAVAQITARAAAADRRIGVESDGRPAWLCRDALGQISLALTLTDYAAGNWADLAVTLAWRLPATRAALAAGRIDLERARVIAEATRVLSEDAARAVEQQVLPGAGGVTKPLLRERARRAVIAADPEAAERRRKDAERRAEVRLYAEDDQTATLVGSRLPQVHAAASFARITALARARIAAGLPGSLNLHRAQVMLGLLLGTLPYIPPAEGAPPDPAPPGPDGSGLDDPGPARPGPGLADPGEPGRAAAAGGSPDPADGHGPGPADGRRGPAGGGSPGDAGIDGGPRDDLPAPRDEDAPPDDGHDDGGDAAFAAEGLAGDDDDRCPAGPVPDWPDLGAIPPALARPARRTGHRQAGCWMSCCPGPPWPG